MRDFLRTGLALFALMASAATAQAQTDTAMHDGMHDGMHDNMQMNMHSTMFMKGTKPVTGGYTLTEDQGQHVLTFSDDFSLGNSPTPYVILSTTAGLGDAPVWLGAVQRARGSQRYIIPKGTDLSRYTHVVIWDKTTMMTLATADLASRGAMSGM
jgi:Electron transfer DM13